MLLRKYNHSCILLEKKDKKLLIDPGLFCFLDGLKPEDIPKPDVVLITHSHADHCDPEILKKICKPTTQVFSNKEVRDMLAKQGVQCTEIPSGEERTIEGFSVKAIDLPHGVLPIPAVQNTGFLIDNTVLHPGDSLEAGITPKVLLLNIAGPTVRRIDAVESARLIKPKIVIPIHDSTLKNWMLEREYATLEKLLGAEGIEIKKLNVGDFLEA